MAGKLAVQGAVPLQFNAYKIPLMRNLGETRDRGSGGSNMGFLEVGYEIHGGKLVPIHIAWFLIWVAAIAGLLFLIVHAIYRAIFRQTSRRNLPARSSAARRGRTIPANVRRHSLAARVFHWIMAASMFTLLFTAFLPKRRRAVPLGDLSLDRRQRR